MSMKSDGKYQVTIALALLAVVFVLWLLAALFILRIVNIFDAYLMKFPGPWITFGLMGICPLAAMVLGVNILRRGRKRALGLACTVGGGLYSNAPISQIAVPLPSPSIGRSTPR